MTREPAPGQSCTARTVASSADVTPTTRRCEYYEYRVTMPRSRPTNTHCSPILAPLSSRPPNNNIISIENKVSSRNFTSCLATLVSLLSSLISHLSSHLSQVSPLDWPVSLQAWLLWSSLSPTLSCLHSRGRLCQGRMITLTSLHSPLTLLSAQVCSCENFAHCDPRDGSCLCSPGWVGDTCSTPCRSGKYGAGCRYDCRCANSATCEHTSGKCECQPGT